MTFLTMPAARPELHLAKPKTSSSQPSLASRHSGRVTEIWASQKELDVKIDGNMQQSISRYGEHAEGLLEHTHQPEIEANTIALERQYHMSARPNRSAFADRCNDESGSSTVPISMAAGSVPRNGAKRESIAHATCYHTDPNDLSLGLPLIDGHVNIAAGDSPYASFTSTGITSTLNTEMSCGPTTAASTQAYIEHPETLRDYSGIHDLCHPLGLGVAAECEMSHPPAMNPFGNLGGSHYGPLPLSNNSQPYSTQEIRYIHQAPAHPRHGALLPSSSPPSTQHMNQSTRASAVEADSNGRTLGFPKQEQDCSIFIGGPGGPSERQVETLVEASVDKNIFHHEVATCYRRNYISVQTCYSLPECPPNAMLFCQAKDQPVARAVQAFGVSLAAAIDRPNGKAVSLVQHTPKRDKGPKSDPGIVLLPPSSTDSHGLNHGHNISSAADGPLLPFQGVDHSRSFFSTSKHTFERIQFQQATANNGRRRAQQQYYYLIVQLHADCRGPHETEPRWVTVARRFSEPIVVRGRSPGHYKDGSKDVSGTGSGGDPSAGSERALPSYDSFMDAQYGSDPGTLGMAFHGGYSMSSGSHHRQQQQAGTFFGSQSPTVYQRQPSPTMDITAASAFDSAGRYVDEVFLPRQDLGHRSYHSNLSYGPPFGSLQEVYTPGRSSRSESSLSVLTQGLMAPNALNSDKSTWQGGSRPAMSNPGFALEGKCGY